MLGEGFPTKCRIRSGFALFEWDCATDILHGRHAESLLTGPSLATRSAEWHIRPRDEV